MYIEKLFLYNSVMGKIYSGDGWLIKVQGDEHPPVHAHVLHPDGKASVSVDGIVKNSGVPNFFCASSLLLRIQLNAFEMQRAASSSFASGMMKEKASTTGSKLRSLLEEGSKKRMLLMEDAISFASLADFER